MSSEDEPVHATSSSGVVPVGMQPVSQGPHAPKPAVRLLPEEEYLLAAWNLDLRVVCHGHYHAATQLDRRSYGIGIPTIVLAAAGGSTALVALVTKFGDWAAIAASTASLSASALASAQLFLRYPERAQKHRTAAAKFGNLLREVEQYQAVPPIDFQGWCVDFRRRWDQVAGDDGPPVPQRIYYRLSKKCREVAESQTRGRAS